MDPQQLFFVLASALVVLVLAGLVPNVWQAARGPHAEAGAQRRAWRTLALLALAVPALAFGLYSLRGNPGALGDERAALSEEWLQAGLPADGEALEPLQAALTAHLEQQPNDPRALVLQARLDMRGGRFEAAVTAYARAMAGRSKATNDAGVWVEYAEAHGMAQGRTLQGEPMRLVHKALALDAHHFQALDLAGSAAWEQRDYAGAVSYWQRLLVQIPARDPRHAELSQAIERAQQRVRLSLPPAR